MDRCNNPPKIAIIGAGFSGLCSAIQLRKQLNLDSFTIFDENQDVGGTWLVNTYPGCACDVPSHLYSYSFEPNPYWSKTYSGQEEILEYLRNVAKKYEIYPNIKFQHRVTSTEWDDKISKWHVTVLDKTSDREETHVFDILISSIGGLRVPNYPQQFEAFEGSKMHSAVWDSSIELKDKVVAIVGSGASAVQIIPEIADKVKKLLVYQRNAAWVVPKMQFPFSSYTKWAFANVPGVMWGLRNLIFWSNELNISAFRVNTIMGKLSVKLGNYQLNRQVPDPVLREKLTPKYAFGCKRVTPSNEYYPTLCKPNVSVITSKITDVTKDSITNEDGTCEKPDVLILATGFRVQDFFAPLNITSKGGEDLLKKWKKEGPCAYMGIACHSTPNAFFILGPNTGLGHNSIVFSIEVQCQWVVKVISEMSKRNARMVAVKKSAEDEYMASIMESMKTTVWGTYDCGSWYADHRGVITALWPESLISYYNRTKDVDFSHIDFV
ncbi:Baeyer-Villiger monooxygenase [Orchesella cincta]|uniref:Flavin-containing monooxygenase n=1 Tax=Orchesella cincta TaxID=48709 RepID=A0A1D2MKL4_ORCCI|nr:Baeyer-Villiger monooxygenase [Orchesella cincta]